jgi:hypothetical protein
MKTLVVDLLLALQAAGSLPRVLQPRKASHVTRAALDGFIIAVRYRLSNFGMYYALGQSLYRYTRKQLGGELVTNLKDTAAKAAEAAKEALEKAVEATKEVAEKALEATKETTVEAIDITKELAHKAADATKEATSDAASRVKDSVKKVV